MCSMTVHGSLVFCQTMIPDRLRSPFRGILFRSGLLSFWLALALAFLQACAIIFGLGNGCFWWCFEMYSLSISVVAFLNL